MEVKVSFCIEHEPEKADDELEGRMHQALGMTLEDFTRRVVADVQKAIGGRPARVLCVRCYRTKLKKQGFAVKAMRAGTMPDIILGFCGDVADFEVTMLHELLHITRWDEKAVEAKAKEIYKRRRL